MDNKTAESQTTGKKPGPCRACTDFKSWAQSKGVNLPESGKPTVNNLEKNSHNDLECPLTKEELGKNTWSFLHTMAAYYPDQPSERQKCNMKSFIRNFAQFYPCHICAEHFQEDVKLIPPEVNTADDLSKWLCFMHNRVNVRLGKSEFDCSRVRERWLEGWKDDHWRLPDMAEKAKQCWLVAIPGTASMDSAFKELKEAVEKFKGCSATKFHIPSLRSCDFDELIKGTEELPKLELECESLVQKFGGNLATVVDKQTLEHSDVSVDNSTIHDYLLTYKWDQNRYPIDQNIHTILSLILKQCKHSDQLRDTKMRKFNAVSVELNQCLKRRQGPLTTRTYLGDLVTNEDFVVDSKFMKTLLVAVPKHMKELWYQSYERLHEEVIPRSSKIICEEEDFVLFSVVIFLRSEKEFRDQAKMRGFMAREYDLKENEMYEYNAETSFLYAEKNRLQVPLISFLKAQFSEIYIAYVHVKAVKIHIESLLRFGPADPYQAAVLFVDEKEANKVRGVLQKLYGKLEEQGKKLKEDEVMDSTTGEYYPYVYTRIKASIAEFMKK